MIAIDEAGRLQRTVVFGSGGVAGMAWEAGYVAGLFEAGLDLRDFDAVVGTSAGAVVGTHLAAGVLPDILYRRFSGLDGDLDEKYRPYSTREVDLKNRQLLAKLGGDVAEARRRIGRLALRGATASLEERHGIIRARLNGMDWPPKTLGLVAVDVHSGDGVVFHAGSGVPLLNALAASCAVPGTWPAEPVADRLFMDGGVRSGTNADFAAAARVLIIAPLGWQLDNPVSGRLREEVLALEEGGAKVTVVVPNARSIDAMGDNILDPSRARLAAEAGRLQAIASADLIERLSC